MVINAFFGWDFNSCESLLSNGVGTRSTLPTPARIPR